MAERLNWGIIGTGNIARKFAIGLGKSRTGRLSAVASRSNEKARKFADEFGAHHAYGCYEDLLADADVQIVYISTPHPLHARWAIVAARAGKGILCEKPIGLNHPEAMAIVEEALANDVFLMEAFMYRCHPQTARLIELLRSRAIGDVRVIHAAFSFAATFNPDGRLFNNALGGGGILDVGCYPVSMARLVAGLATGKDFADPVEIKAAGKLCETGVDEYTVATLRFPGDVVASLATGITVWQDPTVRIFGTDGCIEIPDPWIPSREGGRTTIRIIRNGRTDEIVIDCPDYLYAIEADTVAAHFEHKQAVFPAMTPADTLGNMRTLDAWRKAIGVVYDGEKPDVVGTVDGGGLTVGGSSGVASPKMKYGEIPGIGKPVSRLIMGVDSIDWMPHAAVMMDDFIRRGGNCFDTAHIYGCGKSERTLGQWIANRGIRKDVVILDKGAHTPWCTPEDLTRQHVESLTRLQTDYVDLYMIHRDNHAVPAGEFIDVLNVHVRAGTMRAFGVSNWTLDRVEQANEYARRNGLIGIVAVSNNFSLARMVDAPWPGCLTNSDAQSREWFTKTKIPLLPWSSQARGFFSRGNPTDFSDAEMVRCWHSDDNFRRLQRARVLAAKRGVESVAVALAYVLCQPFATFPLIGPHSLSETRTSFAALNLELSPHETAWLNLEIDTM